MNTKLFWTFLFSLFFLLCSCTADQKETTSTNNQSKVAPANLKWQEIADLLAERMKIQPEEKVVILARANRFDPLIPLLREKVNSAGGVDLGVINADGTSPTEWESFFTKELEGKSREEMKPFFEVIDLGIMMPGVSTADPAYLAIQDVLKGRIGRTIHFHWSGAYDLNGNPLDITPEIDSFYQRVFLETDYQKLATDQLAFEEAMRGKKIQVTTSEGTDITFQIADRPVTKQDGDASAKRAALAKNLIDREIELPAGAIRVAPFERTVNGVIVFPDGQWNGQAVEGLRMELKEGQIVDMTARSGLEAVQSELADKGEAGKRFREFALGFNPLMAIPDSAPWIAYYGYGAGVVRLSLGDNTELGGKVEGPYVRWNFFPYATVRVGEELWVDKGRLLK